MLPEELDASLSEAAKRSSDPEQDEMADALEDEGCPLLATLCRYGLAQTFSTYDFLDEYTDRLRSLLRLVPEASGVSASVRWMTEIETDRCGLLVESADSKGNVHYRVHRTGDMPSTADVPFLAAAFNALTPPHWRARVLEDDTVAILLVVPEPLRPVLDDLQSSLLEERGIVDDEEYAFEDEDEDESHEGVDDELPRLEELTATQLSQHWRDVR